MKKSIKSLLFALIIFTSVVLLVACKKTKVTTTTKKPTTTTALQDKGVLGDFGASVDGVYTIETNTATELSFTYQKGEHADAYLKKSVSNLKGYNTLKIVVKGATTFAISLVREDQEIMVKAISNVDGQTYDWNLRNEDLSKVSEIRIYAAPGKTNLPGSLTVSALTFTKTNAGAGGVYILNTGDDIIPKTTIDYDGGETLNAIGKYVENDANTYAFTYGENNSNCVITSTKGDKEWAFFSNSFGQVPAEFKGMIITVKGPQGTKILVKPDDNEGGDNWYVIQNDDVEETFYVALKPAGGIKKCLYFVNPGSKQDATITITKSELVKTPVTKNEIGNKVTGFLSISENVYQFSTKEDGSVDVTYNVPKEDWPGFKAFIASRHNSGMTSGNGTLLKVTLKGKEGDKVLLKPNNVNANEMWCELTSSEAEEFIIPKEKTPQWLNELIVLVNPNMPNNQEGTINVLVEFVSADTLIPSVKYNNETNVVDANGFWVDGSETEDYKITKALDGSVEVTVDKKSQYSYMKELFVGFEKLNFTKMLLVIKGKHNDLIKFKPNDNSSFEVDVILTGEKQVVEINLPQGLKTVLLFYNIEQETAQSTFTIYSAILATPAGSLMGLEDGGDNVYNVSSLANGYHVQYNKNATQQWSSLKIAALSLEEGSVIGFAIKGDLGTKIKLKLNNNSAAEFDYVLDGTLHFFVTEFRAVANPITQLLIFVDYDKYSSAGSFDIVLAELKTAVEIDTNTYVSGSVFDINNYWKDLGDGCYNISKEGTTVTVESKDNKGEWSAFLTKIANVTDQFNYLHLIVKGTAGEKILVKPNDKGELEKTIAFDGTSQEFYIPIDSGIAKVVMFFEPGTAGKVGSFTIEKAELLKTEEVKVGAFITGFNQIDHIQVTVVDNSVTFTASSEKGEWEAVGANLFGKTTGLKLRVTVTNAGEATKLLLKPNNDGSLETWVDIVDGAATFDFAGEKLPETIKSLYIFPNGSIAGAATMTITFEWVAI